MTDKTDNKTIDTETKSKFKKIKFRLPNPFMRECPHNCGSKHPLFAKPKIRFPYRIVRVDRVDKVE